MFDVSSKSNEKKINYFKRKIIAPFKDELL